MPFISSKFRFGSRYDDYINRVKSRTFEDVERPATHCGPLDAGFDDYEQDIIDESNKTYGIRLPRSS